MLEARKPRRQSPRHKPMPKSVMEIKRAVTADVLIDRPRRGQTKEWKLWARRCIERSLTGDLVNKDVAIALGVTGPRLVSMQDQARGNGGRSLYNPGVSGQAAYTPDEVAAEYAGILMNQRGNRDARSRSKMVDTLRRLVRKSQHERGERMVPLNWMPSRSLIMNLDRAVGSDARVPQVLTACSLSLSLLCSRLPFTHMHGCAQADNSSRETALGSARNAQSNFAGLLVACDSQFTSDGKDVHPMMRGNCDAFTVVKNKAGPKVVTIVVKGPVFDKYPGLVSQLRATKSVPLTTRRDDSLHHVRASAFCTSPIYP